MRLLRFGPESRSYAIGIVDLSGKKHQGKTGMDIQTDLFKDNVMLSSLSFYKTPTSGRFAN